MSALLSTREKGLWARGRGVGAGKGVGPSWIKTSHPRSEGIKWGGGGWRIREAAPVSPSPAQDACRILAAHACSAWAVRCRRARSEEPGRRPSSRHRLPPRPPRAGRTEHLRPILSKVPKGLAAARTAPVRCRSPGQEPGGRALAPTRPGLSGGEPEIPCLGLRLPHLADAGRRGLPDSHGPIELCALKWSPVSESTSSPCRAHCAGWEGSTRVLVQVRATQNQPSSTARAVSEPCALWCGLRSPQVAVPSQLPFEGLILCQSLVESVGRCPVRTSWV